MGYYWGLELYHYGVKRKSGRYPYGSGERPFQDDPKKAAKLRKKNLRIANAYQTKREYEQIQIHKKKKYVSRLKEGRYKSIAEKLTNRFIEKRTPYLIKYSNKVNEYLEQIGHYTIAEGIKYYGVYDYYLWTGKKFV